MGDWTGTVPDHTAGQPVFGADLAVHAAIDTALTDAWSTWSPTNGNITVGSGTVTAQYVRLGKTVDFVWKFLLGSGSAVGTGPNFTLPVTPHAAFATTFTHIGRVTLIDTGTAHYEGAARLNSSTTAEIIVFGASGTHVSQVGVSSTVPFTFTSGDAIVVVGRYQAA